MQTIQKSIDNLKVEAPKNQVLWDVLHMFATRQRARAMVTVRGLSARMKAEGFEHDEKEYSKVLRALAQAGFGTLDTDSKGQVRALKEIKVTLQSIGQAVLGQQPAGEGLKAFKHRAKYTTLISKAAPATHKQLERRQVEDRRAQLAATPINMTFEVNGKPVTMTLPRDLSSEEIVLLVSRFSGKQPNA